MSGYSFIGQQTSPKPLVVGSNPSAASYFSHHHPTAEQTSNFESLIQQIAQLSPQERDALISLTQTDKSSLLTRPIEGVEDWKNHMIARGLAGGGWGRTRG